MKNKRKIGFEMEEEAAKFLISCGYEILERNFYTRFGELDMVATQEGCLVFVEVKYRKTAAYGYPEEAITAVKKNAMRKAAQYYLYLHQNFDGKPCRFDLVSILGDKFQIMENCLE